MKNSKPLWIAIGILAISNIGLIWWACNPEKTITAYKLNTQEIILHDSTNNDKEVMRISGESGGTIFVGYKEKEGIMISATNSTITVGGEPDLTIIAPWGIHVNNIPVKLVDRWGGNISSTP